MRGRSSAGGNTAVPDEIDAELAPSTLPPFANDENKALDRAVRVSKRHRAAVTRKLQVESARC